MRALKLESDGLQLLTAHPAPGGAGEAIVRPTRVAVGSTDVEVCRGLMGFRGVVGQQFVGVVESVDDPEGRALVGQRVVSSPIVSCAACDLCRSGLSAHCRQRTIIGMSGRDGCLAEQIALPVRNLVPVPDSVDDSRAIFAWLVASAQHVAQQLTIEGRPYITVLGDGPLGMIVAQVLVRQNASVRVVGRYSEKMSRCERWEIRHRHVDDVGRRSDQDIVIDCTGHPDGLSDALQLVRPRGQIVRKTLLAAGNRMERQPLDLNSLVLEEIQLLGSGGGSGAGSIAGAIDALERNAVDVVGLADRRMRLDDGPRILHAVAEVGAMAVDVEI
ncbi:MAG: alcohol dehydrogenase catalytic domain-containing protein [Planctomycetota bacterium]|jgi:alcohol dehydrogenase